MERSHRSWFWAAVVAAALAYPALAAAMPFSSLVVFGDSLADTGNNATVLDSLAPPGTLRTPVPIPGPTFIPDYPYSPSNRYSNGNVWVDYLANDLGLSSTPSLQGGSNYAYGGARTGPAGSSFPYSLLDQTQQYLAAHGGVASPGALFAIEGGGDDARDIFTAAASGASPATIASLISTYAGNEVGIVSGLLNAGARDVLLWNIPDVGKAPAVEALGPLASAGMSALVEEMNAAANAALAASLPASLASGIRTFDAFGLTDSVMADPAAYGFTNVTSACAASAACIASPDTTFFWDGVHPTTAAQQVFAQAAYWRAVPEPGTLALVACGLLVLAFERRGAARRPS